MVHWHPFSKPHLHAFLNLHQWQEPSVIMACPGLFETQDHGICVSSFFSDPLESPASSLLALHYRLNWYLSRKRERKLFYFVVMQPALGICFFQLPGLLSEPLCDVFFIAVANQVYRLAGIGGDTLLLFFVYVLYFASDDFLLSCL